MKIVAINGAWRKNGTTAQFVNEALAGAASLGAETESILLGEADIRPCTNCLACYRDLTSDLAPCPIEDDMTTLLQKVMEADGVLLASPLHNAFASGLMVTFLERMVWRVCIPAQRLIFFNNCPYPRTPKVRALGVIVSAGGMPERIKRHLPVMPWLKSNGLDYLNGHWVGEFFGASHFSRMPESDEDWKRVYFLRQISRSQLQSCRDLGIRMAEIIRAGPMKPTPDVGPVKNALLRFIFGRGRIFRTAD